MVQKLTAEQAARVDLIQGFLKTVDHVDRLVRELDSNRAAKSKLIDSLCESIARQLSQMRQRALTTGVGTVADVAGAMSVMAGRGGDQHEDSRPHGRREQPTSTARPGAQARHDAGPEESA